MESSQSPGALREEVSDDEEQAFSAVTRESTREEPATGLQNRRARGGRQRPPAVRPSGVNNIANDLSRVSLSGQKVADMAVKADGHDGSPVSIDAEHTEQKIPPKVVETKVVEDATEPSASNLPVSTDVSTTVASTVTSSTESKVKKSTLDPNAPLFHPKGLQYVVPQPPVQQPTPQTQPVPYSAAPTVVSVSHPVSFTMQTLPPLLAQQQAQRYAAVPMSYASHTNQIPHLVQNMVSGPVPANMHHQVRAGTLPPNLHQGFPAALNPGANIFLQHPQQPAISVGQMTSQPMFVTGPPHGNPFTTTANMSLARQRSNESSSTTHSNYGQPQPSVSMASLQSYHLSHSANGMPILVPAPPVGSHLFPTGVPGAGCSSPLMLGNVAMPQSSGQPVYQGQQLLTVPSNPMQVPAAPNEQAPPSSTTPQQSTQQPFPPTLGHFSEHGHPFPILQYAQGVMFAPNQPNAGYYPAPAVIAAPNPINPAGLLPMVNHSAPNTQPQQNAHPQAIDPSMVSSQLSNPQFQQMSCQPQQLFSQFGATPAQFVHAQPLNPQTMAQNVYQAMAGIANGGGNNPPQGH